MRWWATHWVAAVLMVAGYGSAAAQGPANDDFADAEDLGGAFGVVSTSNVNATSEVGEPEHAGEPGGKSLWWRWTAPSTGLVVFDTLGSDFDTTLGIYTGTAVDALTEVASNDQALGTDQSVVEVQVTAGSVYFIAVDGFFGASGSVNLRISVGLTNDALAAATVLSGDLVSASGTNVGATKEVGEPAHAGNSGGASVWWEWAAARSGAVTLDTAGSDFDTLLAVYTGVAVDGLSEVASNDDVLELGRQSLLSFAAVAGTVYRIAVDGYSGGTGNIVLNLRQAVANDAFADRTDLGSGTVTVEGSNSGATVEAGEVPHAGEAGGRSVWWSWTAVASGSVRVATTGSDFDTVLAVYTGGTLGTLSEVASSNDSGGGLQSKVEFQAVAGVSYAIAVDGVGGAEGRIVLGVDAGLVGDSFADRVALGAGTSVAVTGSNVGATGEPGEPRHSGDVASASLWWTWTAPANGHVVVDTLGSGIDTLLGVYSGESLGALVEVAGNDDAGAGVVQSEVGFLMVAGETYQIAVDGFDGEEGDILLNLRATVVGAPANDGFSTATDLGAVLVTVGAGDLGGATPEPGEEGHAGSAAARSLWWKWTAPVAGDVVLRFGDGEFVPRVAVYEDGVLGSLVEVGSGDGERDVGFRAVAGATYLIAVDARGDGGFGSFGFRLVDLTNDDFAGRTDLGGATGVFEGTNLGAGAESGEPDHAGVAASGSVWWSWTAGADGRVRMGTAGSGFDTVLAVYTGTEIGGLVRVAANDDARPSTPLSEVVFEAVAGTIYVIAVDGYGGGQGRIALGIDGAGVVEPPPGNDDFADRSDLGSGALIGVDATNAGATTEAGEPPGEATVWWKWTAAANGRVEVDTFGSGFDTVLGIYRGAGLGGLVEVASNDDSMVPASAQSRVSFEVDAGVEYQIVVGGREAHRGAIRLNVRAVLREVPGNDDFAGRVDLGEVLVATATGDTRGATAEDGEPGHAGTAARRSLWWQWTAPVDGDVRIDFGGAVPRVGVYKGSSLGGLVGVETSATGRGLGFRASGGEVYQIAVDGDGVFGLRIVDLANDGLGERTVLSGGFGSYVGTNYGATAEVGEPDHGGRVAGSSVWWEWAAAASGRVTVATRGSDFDTVLEVYRGAGFGGLVRVAGNDDAGPGVAQSEASFDAVGGTVYLIAVDGYQGAQGEVVLTVGAGLAKPVNDGSGERIDLGGAMVIAETATNVGAGIEEGEAGRAGQAAMASVWWEWTAAVTSDVVLETAGSEIDTVLAVFGTGGGGGLEEIVSNDDASPEDDTSRVEFRAGAGSVYRIVVDGFAGQQGSVVLGGEATPVVVPGNDAFSGRADLGSGAGVTGVGDLTNATAEAGEPGHAGSAASRSLWWEWTAAVTGEFLVVLEGGEAVPRVGVYSGDVLGGLAEVAAGVGGVRFAVVGGERYVLAFDAGTGNGAFGFSIVEPGNDLFMDRVDLGGASGVFAGSNVGMGAEAGEPGHAGLGAVASAWWSWTAPGDGEVTIDTLGSGFDTRLGVYVGDGVGALTEVASNDDADADGGVEQSSVSFMGVGGVTYHVAVDGYEGEVGEVVLRVNAGPVESAYETWARENGIEGGPLGNADGDEDLNLSEFGYGTEGDVANGDVGVLDGGVVRRGSPVIMFDGDEPLVLFGRQKARAAMGLVYTVRFSADLVVWVVGNDAPVVLADDGEIEVVAVPFPRIGGVEAGYFQVGVAEGGGG